jgi:hypothetical protein
MTDHDNSPGLSEALTMTGCRDAAGLIDMANVGRSMMDRMAEVTADGPFKGWAPADDPAEIVTDLWGALDDATTENQALRGLRPLEGEELVSRVKAHRTRYNSTLTESVQAVRAGWHADADWQNAFIRATQAEAALEEAEALGGTLRKDLATALRRKDLAEQTLSTIQQENERLREVIDDAALWHDSRYDDLGKEPPTVDRTWRRSELREERDRLRAALHPLPSQGGEDHVG